jgi:hypothetical protein
MTEQLRMLTRRTPRNVLGVGALVLGILALITSVSLLGLLFGCLTVGLGLAARDRVIRGEATNRKTTITAMVLAVFAIIIGLAALAFRIWLIV